MIGSSAELQLLLAAAFFYLYDASVLLHADEGLLSPAGGRAWAIVYRPNSIALRGRLVYVPNLLLPHRPVYRLAWSAAALSFADSDAWDERRARYSVLVPFVYLAALSIFVLLPVCLLWGRSDIQVLVVAALIYANSVAAGIAVVRCRGALGLERRRAWTTAIECVLCPPFTVNLIRRLSIHERIAASIPAAGAALLGAADWDALKTKLVASQDDDIEDATSDDARGALLQARATLMAAKTRHDHD